jgi:hypothetical protein
LQTAPWKALPANLEWGALILTALFVVGICNAGPLVDFYNSGIRPLLSGTPKEATLRDLGWLWPSAVGAAMALGLAWYGVRRKTFAAEKAAGTPADGDPNLERLGLYLGLITGLGLSVRNGLKGWFNIYMQMKPEKYWSDLLWQYLGPAFLVLLIAIGLWVLLRPLPRDFRENLFPHDHRLMWLVLVVQNVLGQLVTGPLTEWNEVAFNIYYLLLLAITAVIVLYFDAAKGRCAEQ